MSTTKKRATTPGVSGHLERKEVEVELLHLDAENPRLRGSLRARPTDDEIVEVLWRDMAVDEIAISIAANGYQRYEPLFATHEGNRWIVIEGNRRLAAV